MTNRPRATIKAPKYHAKPPGFLARQFSIPDTADARGLERQRGELLYIEEISAFQVSVALGVARFNRRRLDQGLDARLCDVGLVKSQGSRDFGEMPFYVRDHHVLDLELGSRMGRVDVPGSGSGTWRCSQRGHGVFSSSLG